MTREKGMWFRVRSSDNLFVFLVKTKVSSAWNWLTLDNSRCRSFSQIFHVAVYCSADRFTGVLADWQSGWQTGRTSVTPFGSFFSPLIGISDSWLPFYSSLFFFPSFFISALFINLICSSSFSCWSVSLLCLDGNIQSRTSRFEDRNCQCVILLLVQYELLISLWFFHLMRGYNFLFEQKIVSLTLVSLFTTPAQESVIGHFSGCHARPRVAVYNISLALSLIKTDISHNTSVH